MKLIKTTLVSLLTLIVSAHATIYDDFNDGNDTGWSRQSPLSPFGAGVAYSFPNGNSYQLFAPVSPDPGNLGPARGGSLRLDETYGQFFQTVDIIDWNAGQPNMVMGMLARVSQPGPASTNGYSLTITLGGALDISRITGEAPSAFSPVATAPAGPLVTGEDYRLVFSGNGSAFSGHIYNLANLAVPLASVSGTDATYALGNSGVLVYSNSAGGSATATFDNYYSSVPEPSSLFLIGGGALVALMRRKNRIA